MLFTAGVVSIAVAVLHLVPLPPLDGARIMWALAPPTPGWQKARYNLEEQNYGLGALIVLLLPIFGNRGLVARMVDAVTEPVVEPILELFGAG
jgi:Zn-dependent protease